MSRARDIADGKFANDLTVETSSSGEFNALTISQANNTSGNESRIRFKRTTDAGSDREVAAIVADRIGGNDTDLAFETNTDGADGAVEKMRLSHLGILSVDQVFGLSDTDTGVALGANGADIIQVYTGNTERMQINASGHVTMPFQPVAAVSYSGSNLSPTNVIPLNSGGFTRGGMTTSSDRITVPVAGVYFVGFHHLGATSGAQIQIRVNGAAVAGGQTQEASGGNDNVSAHDTLNLSATDYIEFAVVSSGSIHGNANFNRMYAYLIG